MLEDEFRSVRDFCINQAEVNLFYSKKIRPETERNSSRLRHRITVSGRTGNIFEVYMLDVSQYTGSRKKRGLEIVEFWRQSSNERLRRGSLVYPGG